MSPSSDIEAFQKSLKDSKHIIVVSGAGLSAASGVATFRGNGGRWGKYNPLDVATRNAFEENQAKVWQFFHYRREEVKNATPNKAHYILARLSSPSIRDTIAPNSKFNHITQNIDGLCGKALSEVSSQFDNPHIEKDALIEMHGRLYDVKCTAHDCEFVAENRDSPICPALGGIETQIEEGNLDPIVRRKDLPHCPSCGQLLRPDVVWFGERPKRIHDILELAKQADMCLVVGTSAIVQPASRISGIIKEQGGKVAVFNMEHSNHSDQADFLFLGPCEETLGKALNI